MNREKQIEEMAELERLLRIRRMDIEKQGCNIRALIKKTESEEQSIADYLIGQGYRKASEVAAELFAEISKASANWGCYCISAFKWGYVTSDVSRTLAELKKKYMESEDTE